VVCVSCMVVASSVPDDQNLRKSGYLAITKSMGHDMNLLC